VFDYGRLKNQVLVQDARFQQLYEVYQDTVLRAARELDDAAVSFAKGRTQVDLLEQAVQAAKRAIDGTYYGDMRAWLDWETAQAAGPLLSEDRKAGLAAAAARTRADFKGK